MGEITNERIDFWRGFSGGLLAGVAIGAFIYFSPRNSSETGALTDAGGDRQPADPLFLHRDAAESAGDPAGLLPEAARISKVEFERHKQNAS
jgi:hypothetical protein